MNCPKHPTVKMQRSFRDYHFCGHPACGWWRKRRFPFGGLKRERYGPELLPATDFWM